MGKRQRRRFTEAFKQETVRRCLRHDRSIGQVARELDLTESAVRRWVQQYEVDHGLNPSGALTTEEKTELRTLRREVRVLREEREILKNPRRVPPFPVGAETPGRVCCEPAEGERPSASWWHDPVKKAHGIRERVFDQHALRVAGDECLGRDCLLVGYQDRGVFVTEVEHVELAERGKSTISLRSVGDRRRSVMTEIPISSKRPRLAYVVKRESNTRWRGRSIGDGFGRTRCGAR